MRLRYKLLFPLFACILTTSALNDGVYAHTHAIDHTKKPSHRLTSGSNSNYSLLANPIESIPIINLQAHKTVHCVQAIFCTLNDFTVCIRCYNFFSGCRQSLFASSQKTLLFPFHAFW